MFLLLSNLFICTDYLSYVPRALHASLAVRWEIPPVNQTFGISLQAILGILEGRQG
jgi:hypothetical protein